MTNDNTKTIRIQSVLSICTIIAGLILMTYMIVAEDELGAIPLILIMSGILLYLYDRLKRGGQSGLNKNAS
ncbi:hypothetical protein [Rhodohalobacter sp. 8-1]|uniref:hypothetical protein n=1 Tax=Rhodohalobacter sp. 8-1 TaxID=3131972 RepID=UPI0030ED6D63